MRNILVNEKIHHQFLHISVFDSFEMFYNEQTDLCLIILIEQKNYKI